MSQSLGRVIYFSNHDLTFAHASISLERGKRNSQRALPFRGQANDRFEETCLFFPVIRETFLFNKQRSVATMDPQNNDLSQSLTGSMGGGADDNASQTSQRSGASLLQRIQMQRNREAQEQSSSSSNTYNLHARPAQQIQVPQYNPGPSQENFAGGGPVSEPGNNLFSSAWNNISTSVESGMASLQQERTGGMEASDALLAPSSQNEHGDEEYSMSKYFLTFVRDVNGLFYSLPMWARVVVVIMLLYVAVKLL
jgi:hypothetical protein